MREILLLFRSILKRQDTSLFQWGRSFTLVTLRQRNLESSNYVAIRALLFSVFIPVSVLNLGLQGGITPGECLLLTTRPSKRPFATNDHMVQNPPCWRGSSLLFPHWDIKTKRPEPVKLDLPLF